MSFDRIDRQFRPKPKIVLECADCGTSKEVESREMVAGQDNKPLCFDCYRTYIFWRAVSE